MSVVRPFVAQRDDLAARPTDIPASYRAAAGRLSTATTAVTGKEQEQEQQDKPPVMLLVVLLHCNWLYCYTATVLRELLSEYGKSKI
jgi:hypothetical protein